MNSFHHDILTIAQPLLAGGCVRVVLPVSRSAQENETKLTMFWVDGGWYGDSGG